MILHNIVIDMESYQDILKRKKIKEATNLKFHDILAQEMNKKEKLNGKKVEKTEVPRQELLQRMSSKKGFVWIKVESA